MDVMKLPDYNSYWAAETRYPKIANVMSTKRFKQLQKYVHAVDNTTKYKPGNKNDKFYQEKMNKNQVFQQSTVNANEIYQLDVLKVCFKLLYEKSNDWTFSWSSLFPRCFKPLYERSNYRLFS